MRFERPSKLLLAVVLLVLVMIMGISIISLSSGFKIVRETRHSSHNLEQQITKLSELATVKYRYKDVMEYSDSMRIKGINLPLTNKKYLVVYGGYIKAGVDLKDTEVEVIDENSVKLIVGKPRVLDNVIDEKITSVYDEKDGLFNKITITDYTDIQKENKEKLENEIIENGLLDEAERNAKELLTAILIGFGYDNISILFK
ncbi:MAG: DUF4230 domain-containing protein [Anaerovoracaceae bacterium]